MSSTSPRQFGKATNLGLGSGTDREIWAAMIRFLRATHPEICRQWFEEVEPMGVASGLLRLRAHSNVHRDYLQRQCVKQFSDAAQAATGRLISVRFLGPNDEAGPIEGRKAPAGPAAAAPGTGLAAGSNGSAGTADRSWTGGHPASDEQAASNHASTAEAGLPYEPVMKVASEAAAPAIVPTDAPVAYDDGLVLNPDYSFEHFVPGPGSRLAHAAAIAVSEKPGRAYNPYFVHGNVGLGKTHLLQAICLNIANANPDAVIYYTSCEGFMTQFMDAVQAGAISRFRYKFRHVDVLVVDDIHFLAKRDRTQEEFFHTFNSLYQSHKQIVISSDAAPDDIPDLEERLVSRFKWGLVTTLQPPCFETRVEILRSKAKIRGLEMPKDVAEFIAGRLDTNIRELEGAIVKLQVVSAVEKVPIDLSMAHRALGGENTSRQPPRVQIQSIVEGVTSFYGVKMTDLQSKRRQRSIALPRQLCMYLARKHTRFSLEEIGGHFGGRDHTTVMHAVRTIEDRRTSETEFNLIVKQLEEKMRLGVS